MPKSRATAPALNHEASMKGCEKRRDISPASRHRRDAADEIGIWIAVGTSEQN